MPLYPNSGFGGGRQYRETALPLPGSAVVIDVRQTSDLRLIWYLATEVEDLAREMRLDQAYQWRLLAECIDFLKLDILGPEPVPNSSSSFVIKTGDGDTLPMLGNNELARHIGKNYINRVRNSRIKAINDGEQAETVSPEQSTVRVFFLADLNEEESFSRAVIYGQWLKEWCNDDAGPTRIGRNERIETVVICMNAAPHRHSNLLTDLDSLTALDTVILLQTYRDDDGYIDEEAQIYQAELLLYTLLLHWPESLEQRIDDMLSDALDGKKTLPRSTYIVGISAFEYSARWGVRWLDYGLAAKIIEILSDSQEVQREDKQLQFEVETWWKDWWQRLQAIVPASLTMVLSTLQALDQLQRLMVASNFRHNSPNSLLQSLVDFRQQVAWLYTGASGPTLQLALDSAPLIPSQLKQSYEKTSWGGDDNSPASEIYHMLSELQTQAQLFLLPLFHNAHGALPRALRQLAALSTHTNKLRQIVQSPPNLHEYRNEFEKQAEEAQKHLDRLLQARRWSLRSRKELQRERINIHLELCDTMQIHLAKVREAILYQERLDRLGKDLNAAQKQAVRQQDISNERLKFSLGGTQAATSRGQNWRNLNSRKDLLKWNAITESFLQSCSELRSNPILMDLLAEMLLRRLGAQKSLLNGQDHRNGHYIANYSEQDKNEEYFQAISTALVSALLTAKIGNGELTDILPLLNQYTQMKHLYLLEPSVLDSDVLDVRDAVKEVMLEQAIHGSKSTNFAKKRDLPAEFVLSAWVASQHATNPSLTEALDSRSILVYMGDRNNNPSQMLKDLGKQNKLVGFPDERAGDDHFYLLLPSSETSDAFLKEIDFTQMAQIYPIRFPDTEKLVKYKEDLLAIEGEFCTYL